MHHVCAPLAHWVAPSSRHPAARIAASMTWTLWLELETNTSGRNACTIDSNDACANRSASHNEKRQCSRYVMQTRAGCRNIGLHFTPDPPHFVGVHYRRNIFLLEHRRVCLRPNLLVVRDKHNGSRPIARDIPRRTKHFVLAHVAITPLRVLLVRAWYEPRRSRSIVREVARLTEHLVLARVAITPLHGGGDASWLCVRLRLLDRGNRHSRKGVRACVFGTRVRGSHVTLLVHALPLSVSPSSRHATPSLYLLVHSAGWRVRSIVSSSVVLLHTHTPSRFWELLSSFFCSNACAARRTLDTTPQRRLSIYVGV